jgi:hypothetical protein
LARNFNIKTKTFFQIPPDPKTICDYKEDRVVFMDQAFNLDNIILITECGKVADLWYQFSMHLKWADTNKKIDFDFKRKDDCLMAQRELSRAWIQTGEFSPVTETTEEPPNVQP